MCQGLVKAESWAPHSVPRFAVRQKAVQSLEWDHMVPKQNNNFNYIWAASVSCSHTILYPQGEVEGVPLALVTSPRAWGEEVQQGSRGPGGPGFRLQGRGGSQYFRVLAERSPLGPGFEGLHLFPPEHLRPRRRRQKDAPVGRGGQGRLPVWAGLLSLGNYVVCTFRDQNLRGCPRR